MTLTEFYAEAAEIRDEMLGYFPRDLRDAAGEVYSNKVLALVMNYRRLGEESTIGKMLPGQLRPFMYVCLRSSAPSYDAWVPKRAFAKERSDGKSVDILDLVADKTPLPEARMIEEEARQQAFASLTERETAIVGYMAEGWNQTDIGEFVGLQQRTISDIVQKIRAKFALYGVTSL